ncbi:heavy metal-binding domain-containing protein [Legionella sp. D16C41]|uniref:heavy metal-binding domain-containing protein n=1 Tax=Legionella sp. D16C41 TaxID=3402688 RepID=UPI003AF66846
MTVTTGLSGNELFCLAQKGFLPGNIVVGNSVHSLGIVGNIGSSLKAMLGGELTQITRLIEDGRETALERMQQEAQTQGASGITGVTSQLIFHGSNVEFLSIGSVIKSNNASLKPFSTSADGQELYAQLDAGYQPIAFAFGNVAYAMGVGRGFIGGIKTLVRGEIKEYSNIFNVTRHLALKRIKAHAQTYHANAVLGIQTTVLPFGGVNEMLMIGTASKAPFLINTVDNVITSDMTNIEMWNMASLGYMPLQLLLGTSVYSLGVVGGITSAIKSFVRGEITELSRLIYDARENSLGIINDEAKALGADDVVGVKTYVYQLGNGLIEFLAIGTAVKKLSSVKPQSDQLPPQAIVVDKDTYYSLVNDYGSSVNMNAGSKPINRNVSSFLSLIIFIIFFLLFGGFHLLKAVFE